MKDCDVEAFNNLLKESKVFSVNTPCQLPKATHMKRINEDFLPGDLVFAEFSGYSWPALVTKVRAKTIQIVTLVLEQDELIDKENAVIYGGDDHLQQIMSVLTPGERQDFSEASSSLIELSGKSRLERLDFMKIEKSSVSDENVNSKENNNSLENDVIQNGSPDALRKSSRQKSPSTDKRNGVHTDPSTNVLEQNVTLPINDVIVKNDKPRLTLEFGSPNFCSLDIPINSVDGLVQQPNLSIPMLNGCVTSEYNKMPTKEEKDEAYIATAVELTNQILENPLELIPGHQLSYDNLKLARERAMLMVGAVDHNHRRGRSKTKSCDLFSSKTPDQRTSKVHCDHIKAVRASQKKSLKSLGVPLEIIQTTAKNPSKKPGRKSTAEQESNENAVITQLSAEEAFHDAAAMLVAETETTEKSIDEVANTAVEQLINIGRQKLSENNFSDTIQSTNDKGADKGGDKNLKHFSTNESLLDPLIQEHISDDESKPTESVGPSPSRQKATRSTRISKRGKVEESICKDNHHDTKKNLSIHEESFQEESIFNIDAKQVDESLVAKNKSKKFPSSRRKKTFKTSTVKDDSVKLQNVCVLPDQTKTDSSDSSMSINCSKNECSQIKSSDDSLLLANDSQGVDVINFLLPYYLNLFGDAIKEQLLNQIKLDIERLDQEEKDIIYKLAEGSSRLRKPAIDIISKLVKNSPYQTPSSDSLPEVGPGTPPASPKSNPKPANKVMPQHSRKSSSTSQEVLHNPFPVSLLTIDDKNKKKYYESENTDKKHSVWSRYMRGQGKLALSSKSEKSTSVNKDNSSSKKNRKSPSKYHNLNSSSGNISPNAKSDSPRKHAIALYIQDIQIGMPDPSKLKQSEVKFDTLQPKSQENYLLLGEKMSALSIDDRNLENKALSLYVKSTANSSRLDWLSLPASKKKKIIRDAKKLNSSNNEVFVAKVETFNDNLLLKILNSESRKRKRESQSFDEDSEPSTKKEKGDGTILDFFCLDCFTLDYNTKLYSACTGCHGLFHTTCLESRADRSFGKDPKQRNLCRECREGPVCLLCRKGSNLKSCTHCPYKYHEDCVRTHMSSQVLSATSFICPYHVCGSCEARPEINIKSFVRCVRCPQSFHENHIPAGCMRISRTHILCFRHHKGFGKSESSLTAPKTKNKRKSGIAKKKKFPEPLAHINVPFCFQCTFGGDLICCEGCPASFHNDCVPQENQLKEGEVSWLCPDCIVGKKAFVGDIVWVKFGNYRWWPCQLVDELDLPDNIFAKPHRPCQFPAICLGTNEFSWLDMSRVYSYEDGDKGSVSTSNVSKSFKMALIEAKDLHSKVKPVKEALLQEISSLDKPSTRKPAPYKFIKVNSPYNASMKEYEKQLRMEREPFPCDCTAADKCSADSSCINRVLLTECPPSCKWGEECENQRFQRRQYPATKLVKTEGRGWGLVACQDIIPGSLVHEYVGEIIDEVEVQRRLHHYQTSGITDYYMLTVENSRIIDAKPKANHARFMNHSCDPNCETQKWNVCGLTCIGLFSKRHITSGEELTFDYQFDTRGQQKKACLCGSTNCSGFLGVPAKKIVEIKEVTQSAKKKVKRRKKNTKKKITPEKDGSARVPKQKKQDSSDSSSESNLQKKIPSNKSLKIKTTVRLPVGKATRMTPKRQPNNKKAAASLEKKATTAPDNKAIASPDKKTKLSPDEKAGLSKKRRKTETPDIEDDLQKISQIVSNVEKGESTGVLA